MNLCLVVVEEEEEEVVVVVVVVVVVKEEEVVVVKEMPMVDLEAGVEIAKDNVNAYLLSVVRLEMYLMVVAEKVKVVMVVEIVAVLSNLW